MFIFYHLALHPSETKRLRDELHTVKAITDNNLLLNLPRLNAFISETLRLFPTTPNGGYRKTPADGQNVRRHSIHGGTTIVAPCLQHRKTFVSLQLPQTVRLRLTQKLDPSYSDRPNEFVPDRWLGQANMVRDKKTFALFKQGKVFMATILWCQA